MAVETVTSKYLYKMGAVLDTECVLSNYIVQALYYSKWSAQGEDKKFDREFEGEDEKTYCKGLKERYEAWVEEQPCILTELHNFWANQKETCDG